MLGFWLRFFKIRLSGKCDGFVHFLIIEWEIFLMNEEANIGLMFGGKNSFMRAINKHSVFIILCIVVRVFLNLVLTISHDLCLDLKKVMLVWLISVYK